MTRAPSASQPRRDLLRIERRDLDAEVRDVRLLSGLGLLEPEPRVANLKPDAPGGPVAQRFQPVQNPVEPHALFQVGDVQQHVIDAARRDQPLARRRQIGRHGRGHQRIGRGQELDLDAVGIGEDAADAAAAGELAQAGLFGGLGRAPP